MPVLAKSAHAALLGSLSDRYRSLLDKLEARELNTPNEGCRRRESYRNPQAVCATVGTALDVRMAIADFRTVLKEIERIR